MQTKRVIGRAAQGNDTGRFEILRRESVADGWDHTDDDLPVLRTEVQIETPRSVISYSASPDLPFDRSINPYRGCEHGCIYCFARPTHAYLGMSPGLDFETRLIARPNAPEVLEKQLAAKSYKVAPLAIGTNTDPYQPIERYHKIMRRILETLSVCNHPVAIVTKGALIERDLDILADMAQRNLVRVGVSITSLDPVLSRNMEPRVPGPKRRLKMIENLSKAGVPVRVMASPMVPGLSDSELESILQAGHDVGAKHASWIMLRLPREVSPLFQEWLAAYYPIHAGKIMKRLREMHGSKDYDAQWGKRMRGTGPYAELMQRRFVLACKRLGLSVAAPPLNTDLFRAPVLEGAQMSLF